MTNLECAPPQSRFARQLSRAGRALPSVIVRAANALTLRKRRAQRTVLCAKNAFATHGGAMHAPPEESLLMPPPAEGGRGVGTSSKFLALGGIHFRRGRPHLQRHRRLIVRWNDRDNKPIEAPTPISSTKRFPQESFSPKPKITCASKTTLLRCATQFATPPQAYCPMKRPRRPDKLSRKRQFPRRKDFRRKAFRRNLKLLARAKPRFCAARHNLQRHRRLIVR